MKVLFYSKRSRSYGFEEKLQSLGADLKVEVYRSIEELGQGLCRLLEYDIILILRAESREDLLQLVSLRDLFRDARIILLVPDGEKETLSIAHRVRPRFLGNSEGDFSDTLSVLRKMLGYGD